MSGGLGFTDGLGQDISQEELDFSELFLYNSTEEDFPLGCGKNDSGAFLQDDSQPPMLMVDNQPAYISGSNEPASSQDLSSQIHSSEHLSGEVFDSLGLASRPGARQAPSPRIEITPSGDSLSSQTLELGPGTKALATYRECVSPASSNSSTGWPADAYSPVASPSASPSNGGFGVGLSGLDLSPALQCIHTSSAHSSPGASPCNSITEETFLLPQHQRSVSSNHHQRSRSAPPYGKRSHDQAQFGQGDTPVKQRSRSPSPIPWPQEQQDSYHLHQYQAQAQTSSPGLEMLSGFGSSLPKATPSAVVQEAYGEAQKHDCVYGEKFDRAFEQGRMGRAGPQVKSETIYMLPALLPVHQPVHHGAFSGPPVVPFPSLEWPLPSQSGKYELVIQQQPRSHHRAHYETEGSRGAVKTSNGGHPEVQLRGYQAAALLWLQVYIGTADERFLKPHAFYQVHRVTGKTVTTPSIERMMSGTKVLEIPLEPKNSMTVVIDCVGILKLRNADIELRNGETDIGRKNTRVRLVFRVHVPQPGGQLLSLQVASNPIECSQRSAQELPAVERQNLDQCSVLGGQQMVLTGQNFTSDSKVIFSEKTQDGQQIWEVEAMVDRNKTRANMLFLEVPPYRDQTISHAAKVNFFVINGKKKRSQPQHFIYTPVIAVKSEPLDDCQLNSYGYTDCQSLTGLSMKSLYHHLEQDGNPQAFDISPTLYHLTTVDPRVNMDKQPVCYQSRAGTLVSSPMLYHTANQHYSNCGTNLFGSSQMATNLTSASSQCTSTGVPMAKLVESPHNPCSMSGHENSVQKTLTLGKSPPSRYIHDHARGNKVVPSVQCLTQFSSCRGYQEERTPEKVKVKQESLRHAYLEDVNDIIRRDLTGHNGE